MDNILRTPNDFQSDSTPGPICDIGRPVTDPVRLSRLLVRICQALLDEDLFPRRRFAQRLGCLGILRELRRWSWNAEATFAAVHGDERFGLLGTMPREEFFRLQREAEVIEQVREIGDCEAFASFSTAELDRHKAMQTPAERIDNANQRTDELRLFYAALLGLKRSAAASCIRDDDPAVDFDRQRFERMWKVARRTARDAKTWNRGRLDYPTNPDDDQTLQQMLALYAVNIAKVKELDRKVEDAPRSIDPDSLDKLKGDLQSHQTSGGVWMCRVAIINGIDLELLFDDLRFRMFFPSLRAFLHCKAVGFWDAYTHFRDAPAGKQRRLDLHREWRSPALAAALADDRAKKDAEDATARKIREEVKRIEKERNSSPRYQCNTPTRTQPLQSGIPALTQELVVYYVRCGRLCQCEGCRNLHYDCWEANIRGRFAELPAVHFLTCTPAEWNAVQQRISRKRGQCIRVSVGPGLPDDTVLVAASVAFRGSQPTAPAEAASRLLSALSSSYSIKSARKKPITASRGWGLPRDKRKPSGLKLAGSISPTATTKIGVVLQAVGQVGEERGQPVERQEIEIKGPKMRRFKRGFRLTFSSNSIAATSAQLEAALSALQEGDPEIVGCWSADDDPHDAIRWGFSKREPHGELCGVGVGEDFGL